MNILSHPSVRQSFGLVAGLLVGGIGVALFQQSLPPEVGTVEEQLEEKETELRKAREEIAALKADGKSSRSRRTTRDGMRSIAERINRGEELSLDDVFWTMKPWLRDLSPLFDRIRQVEQENEFDSLAGEFARKYGLSGELRDELKQWLIARGEENSEEFRRVIFSDTSGFVDFVRVTRFDEEDVDGLDEFMEERLEGEALENFKGDRLEERIQNVEAEADRRLQRLAEVVELEEDQVDDMFVVLARGSKQYRDGMEIGVEGADTTPLEHGERDAAIRDVLRGDQLNRFERYQRERRNKAESDMRRIGLSLPDNWQLLDDDEF